MLDLRVSTQRHHYEQGLTRFRGMNRGTNSFHEPLHGSDPTACSEPIDAMDTLKALVNA